MAIQYTCITLSITSKVVAEATTSELKVFAISAHCYEEISHSSDGDKDNSDVASCYLFCNSEAGNL